MVGMAQGHQTRFIYNERAQAYILLSVSVLFPFTHVIQCVVSINNTSEMLTKKPCTNILQQLQMLMCRSYVKMAILEYIRATDTTIMLLTIYIYDSGLTINRRAFNVALPQASAMQWRNFVAGIMSCAFRSANIHYI